MGNIFLNFRIAGRAAGKFVAVLTILSFIGIASAQDPDPVDPFPSDPSNTPLPLPSPGTPLPNNPTPPPQIPNPSKPIPAPVPTPPQQGAKRSGAEILLGRVVMTGLVAGSAYFGTRLASAGVDASLHAKMAGHLVFGATAIAAAGYNFIYRRGEDVSAREHRWLFPQIAAAAALGAGCVFVVSHAGL